MQYGCIGKKLGHSFSAEIHAMLESRPYALREVAPEELDARRHECGIPFWPHAFVRVDGDLEGLLQNWNNEYGCLGYGERLYDQIVAFGELTGIPVIAC